ncbi:hypothetical protein TH53_05885 [Pedobacter lusitanus]|uniref:Fibronectin type-III domain-containing protein n=1 Tax=Pedobacter lusitanus TaxID=1503925 RepID=A0A0D0F8G2_9SPHI|nr:hypothetical protein [Pedobacter lusitanus]KIO77968.1 hypothetical protein TH53_05885 [Pedobacter lusitanus]
MNKSLLVLLGFLFLFAGCKEFIEPSLGGKRVNLLGPGDKAESIIYDQTFWWETHDDALKYRLQIVTPKFDSVTKLIADTLMTGNKFPTSLEPGRYEWRVRPENGSSKGDYTTRSFVIYPSSIKEQSVQASLPAAGLITNAGSQRFEWLKLFGAQNYRLQVDNNNFADETKLILNTVTNNLNYIQQIPSDGTYQWRVRAEAGADNSKWSIVRTFIYDITPPAKVVLSAPGNNQTVTKPAKLVWNTFADADKYELKVCKGDTSTVFNNTFPMILTDGSYTLNEGESTMKIFWKVRAIDKAGNKGAYSDFFSFTIQ